MQALESVTMATALDMIRRFPSAHDGRGAAGKSALYACRGPLQQPVVAPLEVAHHRGPGRPDRGPAGDDPLLPSPRPRAPAEAGLAQPLHVRRPSRASAATGTTPSRPTRPSAGHDPADHARASAPGGRGGVPSGDVGPRAGPAR